MQSTTNDSQQSVSVPAFGASILCFTCAVAMAFGWGWRGSYGHEAGAMVPGALLAMAACLCSGRQDLYRRTAIAGLFGALGWYVGGSLSNMEHNFYIISDSLPDVAYGYFGMGLIGLLWAGVGGGVLALALTRPRSELVSFMRVLVVLWLFWQLLSLYFGIFDEQRANLFRFSRGVFPLADWYTAGSTLLVAGVYWLVRPKERPAARLFIDCALGWWISYLILLKFGGLRLAPPYRGENWSGVVGVLVALLLYLYRQNNRAGLMLALHSTLAGCMGFILAVFIHVPIRLGWGPFPRIAPWKVAEEGFGFFMALGVALSVVYLLRGRLAAPPEDTKREPLDLFAAFVLLVAMMWMNLRKNVRDWGEARYDILVDGTMYGLEAWQWFYLAGCLLTIITLYCLYQYHRERLMLMPKTAFEKGSLLFIVVLLVTMVAAVFHRFPEWNGKDDLVSSVSYLLLGLLAFWLLLTRSVEGRDAEWPSEAGVPPEDPRWNVGLRYLLLWVVGVPLLIAVATASTLGMQDEPNPGSRKRFGPEAFWRQVQEVTGSWRAVYRVQNLDDEGKSTEALPVQQLQFAQRTNVSVTMANGERAADKHRWFHSNPYSRLEWYGRVADHPERVVLTMRFKEKRLYVPWPPERPEEGYIVFEHVDE